MPILTYPTLRLHPHLVLVRLDLELQLTLQLYKSVHFVLDYCAIDELRDYYWSTF